MTILFANELLFSCKFSKLNKFSKINKINEINEVPVFC